MQPAKPAHPQPVLFLIFGGVGLFIILTYAGVIPWQPYKPQLHRRRAIFMDPYHWQILALGMAFFCAGLAFVIPKKWNWLGQANAFLLVASLLAGVIGSFLAR